jgi:hypothetical protein
MFPQSAHLHTTGSLQKRQNLLDIIPFPQLLQSFSWHSLESPAAAIGTCTVFFCDNTGARQEKKAACEMPLTCSHDSAAALQGAAKLGVKYHGSRREAHKSVS